MDVAFKAQGGKLVRSIDRVDQHVIDELATLPASILSDCLDRFNCLGPELKLLHPAPPFAGPAFTVEEIEGGNLMSHLALKYIESGDVLVIDGKRVTTRACWGGLQTLAAKLKGVVAIIIDGAIRDSDDVAKLGVPVYCRGTSPAGPHKGWGGRVNVPVSCGGMLVEPGDVIVGDHDGVVVVPRALAAETLHAAKEKLELERQWFERVRAGQDTADFLGFMDKARALGIEIV